MCSVFHTHTSAEITVDLAEKATKSGDIFITVSAEGSSLSGCAIFVASASSSSSCEPMEKIVQQLQGTK